jgi:hypothetical protein
MLSELANLTNANIAYLALVIIGFFAFMLTLGSTTVWSNRGPGRKANSSSLAPPEAEGRAEPKSLQKAA